MTFVKRIVLVAGFLCAGWALLPSHCPAQVSVNIHIGPPPSYRIAAPPPVIVIPGTYVYVVPDIGTDIFFYDGFWYRLYDGHWFNGRSYNGPWAYMPDPRVPRALMELPPDYRRVPPGWRRIPYGQFKKNWAGWEQNRYWDKDQGWREGWHGKPEEKRDRFEGRPGERRDERRDHVEGRPGGREDNERDRRDGQRGEGPGRGGEHGRGR
jgi:hypothetical protein